MRTQTNRISCQVFAALASVLVAAFGCRKPANDSPSATPPKPNEAAAQLQQAFVNAQVEVKNTAEAASEALRTANYEQAVQSLQTIRMRKDLTFEQGMAVYNSDRALEARLIAAMEAGDPNAKRAYEQLRKTRRN